MITRTVTKALNARTGLPDTAAPNPGFLLPGTSVDIVATVKGKLIEGNDTWYQASDGHFYWSGGFDRTISDSVLTIRQSNPVNQLLNYNSLFEGMDTSLMDNHGDGINIAIFDSGINHSHIDLQQSGIQIAGCFNNDPSGNTADNTSDGHGTHVAGLIAANAAKRTGITGIASAASVRIYKVLTDSGASSTQFLVNALNDIKNKGPMPDIINMSLNIPFKLYSKNAELIALLDEISAKTICVAAAGNNEMLLAANNSLLAPAVHNRFISVGAIKMDFASANPNPVFHQRLDFIVPEFLLFSCSNTDNNSYHQLNGSSMSAAIVTSIIAILLSNDASLKGDPGAVKAALQKITRPWSSVTGLNSFTILKASK